MAISKTWEMRRNYSKVDVTKGIEKNNVYIFS